MSDNFEERLNRILPKLTSPDLLRNQGLGNEIGFWIFDYEPERELEVRSFLSGVIEPRLQKAGIRFSHANLFDMAVEYLREREVLDAVFDVQKNQGDAAVLAELRPMFAETDFARVVAEHVRPSENDLALISGVGAAWPMVRAHTLLSSLHALMGDTPLVMFYPGKYDGLSLRLFGALSEDNYYRAFQLAA